MDKYCDCKIVGLYNLGNTCFINSCIQIINNIYELHFILDKNPIQKNNIQSLLTHEWNDLRNLMWSDNGIVKPIRFINGIQKISTKLNQNLFSGWDQNDISEFLDFFLNCLHETYSREVVIKIHKIDNNYKFCYEYLRKVYQKEYSEIYNTFNGIIVNEISDIENNEILSKSPEMFSMIHLPIMDYKNRQMNTLIDCFELYTSKELLENENAWYNEKTKKHQSVHKRSQIWRFPNILIITLKRFNHRNRKIQNIVDFPIDNLNLQKYSYDKTNVKYDCFGICNHMGNVSGGHYTCFSKNSQGKWMFYNDKQVLKVNNLSNLVTEKAYCLFYRKK